MTDSEAFDREDGNTNISTVKAWDLNRVRMRSELFVPEK